MTVIVFLVTEFGFQNCQFSDLDWILKLYFWIGSVLPV